VLTDQDRLRIANQNVVLASKVYDAIKARFNSHGDGVGCRSTRNGSGAATRHHPDARAGFGANEKHIGP